MIDLPWLSVPSSEGYLIGDETMGALEMPRYGSLTPNEEMAILPAILRWTGGRDEIKDRLSGDEAGAALQQANLEAFVTVAAVILRRVKPDVTEADVSDLPNPLVAALFNFALSERNGWRKAAEVEEEAGE